MRRQRITDWPCTVRSVSRCLHRAQPAARESEIAELSMAYIERVWNMRYAQSKYKLTGGRES